jgi:hypothetical protein
VPWAISAKNLNSHDPFQKRQRTACAACGLRKVSRQPSKGLNQTGASRAASDQATIGVGKDIGAEPLLVKKLFRTKGDDFKMVTGEDCNPARGYEIWSQEGHMTLLLQPPLGPERNPGFDDD